MAQGPSTASATYTCKDCGEGFTGLGPAYWDHAGTHRPFKAVCPDGYTRGFATEDEARAASRDGVVKLAQTTEEYVREVRARRAARD